MKCRPLLFAVLALVACKKSSTDGGQPATPGSATAAAGDPVKGFETPESVLYDDAADVYLVSNIKGKPADADHDGYVSKVSPDGKVLQKAWLTGLDAPKGMAISGGLVWVADITSVRTFDQATGAPKESIAIPGASFLNDVCSDGDGGIFVSDTGIDASFQPTGSDAVYHITKDRKVAPLIKDKGLGGPNGVTPGPDGSVWVVTFGSGELYQVTAKGEKQAATKLPKGQLDGIVVLDGGDLVISSWEGEAVYRGKPGGEWKVVVAGVKSPADIGWDSKRKRLLIPQFNGNQVLFREL